MSAERILETDNVTKKFGGLIAVDSVSIDFPKGVIKAIIGPNGAGKTTLFNLLSGVLAPTSGQIFYKGEEITKLPPQDRSQQGISRSFQLTQVFSALTALENVRIAAQSRGGSAVTYNVLSRAEGYEDFIRKGREILDRVNLSHAYTTRAGDLTRADQRKLDVAIALATEPDLLLLDEPTAGMAVEEIPEILGIIRDLHEDQEDLTTVLIEHKIDVVMELADSLFVLVDGEVLADGTPEEIQENREVQEAYLGGL